MLLRILMFLSALYMSILSDEYISLQPDNVVEDFTNKSGSWTSYSEWIYLNKDAKKSDNDWYIINNDWKKYKLYIPAGVTDAAISYICKPNASYRVHVTFIGNTLSEPVVNHYETLSIGSLPGKMISSYKTHQDLAINGGEMLISGDLVNNSNGGYLYIEIVEDSDNIDSYYGDVNPQIMLGMAFKIVNSAMFETWKNNVTLLDNGNPSAGTPQMKIITKPAPYTSGEKTINLDYVASCDDCDGDGYTTEQGDCEDRLGIGEDINPGVTEIANNNIDDNCNGSKDFDPDVDYDGDTYTPTQGDCFDYIASKNPSTMNMITIENSEASCPHYSSIDFNVLDRDKDGVSINNGDCDDLNAAISPNLTENPNNGINEDCAALISIYKPLHDDVSTLVAQASSGNINITKNIQINNSAYNDENHTWYNNLWSHFEYYLPEGISNATVSLQSSENKEFIVHSTFGGNSNNLINHNVTIQTTTPIQINDGNSSILDTFEFESTSGNVVFSYPSYITETYGANHLYLDIIGSPTAIIPLDITATISFSITDQAAFDNWKENVRIIFDDDPLDNYPTHSTEKLNTRDQWETEFKDNSPAINLPQGNAIWSEIYNSSSSSEVYSSSGASSSSCNPLFDPSCASSSSEAYSSSEESSSSSSEVYSSSGASSSSCNPLFDPSCASSSSEAYSSSEESSSSQQSSSSSENDEDNTIEEDVTVDNNIIIAELLNINTYFISGEFMKYNFENVPDAFDWIFKYYHDNTILQLQGVSPSESDVFGWKNVLVEESEEEYRWFMIYLNYDSDGEIDDSRDIDGDGGIKYDWALFYYSPYSDTKMALKLSGVKANGDFRYSTPLDINYTISEDKKWITITNPQDEGFSSSSAEQ